VVVVDMAVAGLTVNGSILPQPDKNTIQQNILQGIFLLSDYLIDRILERFIGKKHISFSKVLHSIFIKT
jgi:hypothetical protein